MVALRVVISKRAAEQVRRTAQWWAENRPAAPGAVATDFGESIRLLVEQPGIGSKYEGSRTPGVGRLYLNRLQHFVYYKADSEQLKVLAFWSASRGEQPKT
jgi:plasmid stabilization system protein ParE